MKQIINITNFFLIIGFLCICQTGFAQPTITGATCISPDPSATAVVYTVNNPVGNTITGIGQLGDIEITTALPPFPFAGASFSFSARSINRGREITNTCNDYLKPANNHLGVDATNWGFAKGRLTIFYSTNTNCDKLVDLDIYKSFTLHPPIVGPRCIKVGDTVTYSVCNIISGRTADMIGQDRYYWTDNPINNYTNPGDYPVGFNFLYSSADGSSITFLVDGSYTANQTLFCRFGQCASNINTVSSLQLGTTTPKPDITIKNSNQSVTYQPPYCISSGESNIVIEVKQATGNSTFYTYSFNSNNYSWGFGTPPTQPVNWPNPTTGTVSLPVFIAQSGGEIYVKTSGGCDTRTDVVLIGRGLTNPPFSITGNTSLGGNCIAIGANGIFTLNGQPGNVPITWVVPTGWTITGAQNGTQITVRADAGAVNGVIAASIGTCASNVSLPVFVKPTAPTQIQYNGVNYNSGSTVCIPRTATQQSFTATGGSNIVSYSWTFPNGWTPNGSTTNATLAVTPNTTTAGNVIVQGNAGIGSGCLSNNTFITTVYAPAAPSAITGPSCIKGGNALAVSLGVAQSSVSYSVPVVSGTTFTWTIPAGLAVSGTVVQSGTGNSTVTFTCTGNPSATDYIISVTASTGGSCQSVATTKNVTVRLQNNGTDDENVFALTPAFGAQTLIHGFPPANNTAANGAITFYEWFKVATPNVPYQSGSNIRSISLAGSNTANYGVEVTYNNYACKNVFVVPTNYGYRYINPNKKLANVVRGLTGKNETITLQPNPAHNSTTLILPTGKTNVAVSVVNVEGRLLWKRSMVSSTNTTINTANWASGEYTVIIREPNGKAVTKKLIVQNK